eukprot:GHVL01024822.1.p2 GENE.GHVL01024822.1~~GHVL01024822.1.p2  ORF type:complete len:214 (-),score=26.37 GHVL01024822.1:164-805(-)
MKLLTTLLTVAGSLAFTKPRVVNVVINRQFLRQRISCVKIKLFGSRVERADRHKLAQNDYINDIDLISSAPIKFRHLAEEKYDLVEDQSGDEYYYDDDEIEDPSEIVVDAVELLFGKLGIIQENKFPKYEDPKDKESRLLSEEYYGHETNSTRYTDHMLNIEPSDIPQDLAKRFEKNFEQQNPLFAEICETRIQIKRRETKYPIDLAWPEGER